jgi:hypothetical protein
MGFSGFHGELVFHLNRQPPKRRTRHDVESGTRFKELNVAVNHGSAGSRYHLFL